MQARAFGLLIKSLVFATTLTCLFTLTGCQNTPPAASDFNFILNYGVGSKNVLNTFTGTYTKDLIQGPSATTKLPLSKDELEQIHQKMIEIDFFNYPDTFTVDPHISANVVEVGVTPYNSYYFKVQKGTEIKELNWDDKYVVAKSDQADRLRALIKLITGIIQSKPEYKTLPPPRGGYM